MSILTAISRGCKGTLADGTVRYTIDFEPRFAIAAAELFAMPGTEMGVVALKDGHGEQSAGLDDKRTCRSPDDAALPMVIEESSAGGFISSLADQFVDTNKTIAKHITLANYAGIFSNDPKFWEWIGTKTNKPTCEAEAAHYIRWRCNIASRAEIDNSKIASGIFRQIMREFDMWSKK